MPCDIIKIGLYQEHFQKNIETLFPNIQQKTMRLFSQLLCSTIFEHDTHAMTTLLNNQMEDICFESFHDYKKKAKI